MKLHIAYFSDFSVVGSGYSMLSTPLCQGMSSEFDVKAIALEYRGQEHPYDFSMIPVANFQEASATIRNLNSNWGIDVLIVALDIPAQIAFMPTILDLGLKYIGIFPVESNPLCMDWAMRLMSMNGRLVISEFGANECLKVGVPAKHIQLGVDVDSWKIPTVDERKSLRDGFGFNDDTFVVLTVADNQERKNLSVSMRMFAGFLYDYDFPNSPRALTPEEIIEDKKLEPVVDAQYILITRENLPVGWKLGDLAQTLGITKNFKIFERGLDFKKLWATYVVSDVFLLASKAEGLGLPILEAMSVGLPVIATRCTALEELLEDDRGWLIDWNYAHTDPFGNGWRYWANIDHGKRLLKDVRERETNIRVENARKYVESRKWDIAVQTLKEEIGEVCGK